MTRVFIFRLEWDGAIQGIYGAFDESETAAKLRIEQHFKTINRNYNIEAILLDILPAKPMPNVMSRVPIFDRRKEDWEIFEGGVRVERRGA